METIPFKKILCESDRLQTFKNWPFKNGPCTAEKLAKAGFFYAGRNGKAKHHVRCFVCFKKLDELNENLDPFEEHRKENQNCRFVQSGMNQSEIKVADFLQLLRVSVKGSLVSLHLFGSPDFDRQTDARRDCFTQFRPLIHPAPPLHQEYIDEQKRNEERELIESYGIKLDE